MIYREFPFTPKWLFGIAQRATKLEEVELRIDTYHGYEDVAPSFGSYFYEWILGFKGLKKLTVELGEELSEPMSQLLEEKVGVTGKCIRELSEPWIIGLSSKAGDFFVYEITPKRGKVMDFTALSFRGFWDEDVTLGEGEDGSLFLHDQSVFIRTSHE